MNNIEIEISVIIPVFNGEKFINNAYKCIVNQGFKNIEIIFVDNNSTDDSILLIKDLLLKDRRVSLYIETTQGAAAARNMGLSKSIGKYIHFYDVDDTMYKGAYKSLKSILDQFPETDSAFGKTFKSYETFEETIHPIQGNGHITHYKKPYLAKLLLTTNGIVPGTLAYLHRRNVFNVIGDFPENLILGEDVFFSFKINTKYES